MFTPSPVKRPTGNVQYELAGEYECVIIWWMPKRDTLHEHGLAERQRGYARGWLMLGRSDEAARALDSVPDSEQHTIDTLELRCQVFLDTGECVLAAAIARRLTAADPSEPQHWISLAYAVRRSETVEAARTILLEALPRFPLCATIPYNLACYASVLGLFDEARKYLDQAVGLDPDFREAAKNDPDFGPLREFETGDTQK